MAAEPRGEDSLMIEKSVGWTSSGSPGTRDPGESRIDQLEPDEVLVRIDEREADPARDIGSEARAPQDGCRGIRGRVIAAGANALWYVDRAVIVPGSGCASCDADRRDAVIARSDEAATGTGDDAPKVVVVQARRLCVVSVNKNWRKPTLT
ncbi:MAG: hypothetical protein ACLP1D_28565 [Xanthobacteraceae bacterium]